MLSHEQNALRRIGVTGEVATDSQNPVAGIYTEELKASKMDWYLNQSVKVEKKSVTNGVATYHVTLTIKNRLTAEQAATLPSYISNAGGEANRRIYLYTPTGGLIGNVKVQTSNATQSLNFEQLTYQSRVVYRGDIPLYPSNSVIVECDVTTGLNANELKIDMSPSEKVKSDITYTNYAVKNDFDVL